MSWKYEKEYREMYPETIGETDKDFDLYNYKEWLEDLLTSIAFSEKEACECGNRFFKHRHGNWMECTICNKIKFLY